MGWTQVKDLKEHGDFKRKEREAKVQRALKLMALGVTQQDAAQRVGMSANTLRAALKAHEGK